MRTVLQVTLSATLSAMVIACFGGDDGSTAATGGSVTIETFVDRVRFTDTATFAAVTRDAQGTTVSNARVQWRSTAPSVASVTTAGKVIGLATGATWVVAHSNRGADSVNVVVPPHYVEVAAGFGFACARTDNGEAYCWGQPGSLGTTATVPPQGSPRPLRVETDVKFASIFAAPGYACALTEVGEAYCWGSVPLSGTLVRTPQRVAGAPLFRRLALGKFGAYGVSTAGALYWWGWANHVTQPAPVVLDSSRVYTDVAFGEGHGCALASGGDVYCWGYNGSGQYGDGTYQSTYTTPAPSFTGIKGTRVVTGLGHSCVLAVDTSVQCTGSSPSGSLGDGSATPYTNRPVRVLVPVPVTALAAGNQGSCAVTSAGATYCWGAFIIVASTPWRVTPSPVFSQLAIGDGSAYGLATRGWLYAWGTNTNGQLGDGTSTRHDAPLRVLDPP